MQLRPHQVEAVEALSKNNKGQIIVPTGGGKTMCMITDAVKRLKDTEINTDEQVPTTLVVVAPRILLAEQLSTEFMNVIEREVGTISMIHVHSGKFKDIFSTTQPSCISAFTQVSVERQIIFTTYHSLHKIQESGIDVDTIYYDEAHNSVQRNFVEAVDYFSIHAGRCFYFTATPKHSLTPMRVGMNDSDIFGEVLYNVPAPKLVEEGHILPPKVKVYKTDILQKDEITYDVECNQIIDNIDDHNTKKILVCAKSTKQISGLVRYPKFVIELKNRGYDCMYITAKTGAVINGYKVSREEFFTTMREWGVTPDKKFVVLHHSILSEGINVKGLEAVLFLRSMDYIGISQTIGRVIRKGCENKKYGLVCVPVYSKVGISTARKVQAVVDTVFERGEPAISTIRR